MRRGYCLILGCETGELAVELARRSEMMIYAVSPDREKVETARKRIDSSGLYGGRISVEAWPLDGLPYADYFANLVVSETAVLGGQLPPAPAEMFRMLKPVGGVALLGRPAVESIAVHAAGSDSSPKSKRGSQPGPSRGASGYCGSSHFRRRAV